MSHKYYKNMVRVLRLQMKTGYRSEIPAEYEFMKMYPPLHRDTAVQKRVVKPHRIPYLYLYRGAVAKNPVENQMLFPSCFYHEFYLQLHCMRVYKTCFPFMYLQVTFALLSSLNFHIFSSRHILAVRGRSCVSSVLAI